MVGRRSQIAKIIGSGTLRVLFSENHTEDRSQELIQFI